MSLIGLLCLFFGLAALLLLAALMLQRRSIKALREVSLEVQRAVIGGSLRNRIELDTPQPELAALLTAVNQLLSRAAVESERPAPSGAVISALADHVHEAVLIHGQKIRYANPQFARLVGLRVEELVGRRLPDLVPSDYTELVEDNMRRRLAGEPAAERYEVEIGGQERSKARLELSSWPIQFDNEQALLVVGVEVLPTQSSPAQPPANRSRSRLALESLSEALITTDAAGSIEYLNPAAERMLGITGAEAEGKPFQEIARAVEEGDQKLLTEPVQQALSAGMPLNLGRRALLIRSPLGTEHLVELSAAPVRLSTGETVGAVVLLHDVTESRGLARQMSYQATHDALTGLINRREFERRLLEALDNAHRGDGAHVLCYLDLDHFKAVNDTGGHLAGDAMLREVARLLRDAVRDSDTVGRLGGDEFGLLLVGCPLDKARQIADDVCRAVTDFRFVWKDKIFDIGVSIGLVEISRDSGSMEEALAAADSACYVAKRQGGHVTVYSARDEVFARQTGEIQWLQTLQQALRDSRFELFYQPIIASFAANDEGPAMEVLVRLHDDSGRQLPAIEFVRAAERYRLISLVDRWVVMTTLTALGRGAIALPPKRSLAINISGQTLADAQFLEFAVDCFDSTGANPSQVCFEIDEEAVVGNLEQARRFIGVLHGMGCRFALDDFGSGIGSFAKLKLLAVDFLKIDGSFMRNLARDSVNQAMVTAMIKLARTMNFKVIAEQIEDDSSVEAARVIGVDYLQGYALGRPTPLPLAA
jgi:diguanylate cyclase (GGDEF)-like protein/PAS domain S-box-containing protein